MNTKKLIFGFLAVAMLLASTAAAYAVDGQDTGVKRKHTIQKKQR